MLIRILLLHVLFADETDRQKQNEKDQDRYLSERYRWTVQ
jgi:hypothetical protein